MRIHVVDPSAYTPPYDHALCEALGRTGADVELVTSRFAYGAVPAPTAYRVGHRFYRRGTGRPGSRRRRASKLAQHPFDMLAYARHAAHADVVHFQWLTVPSLDVHMLPRKRPVVLTAHDVLGRDPRPGQHAAQRRLYQHVDAVVVHSRHGRDRLVEKLGVAPDAVRVIPHGCFDHLTRLPVERPLPLELQGVDRPVVLCFGLMKPYKGLDVLVESWRGIEDAELWIVGLPKMEIAGLRAASPPNVRWIPRFVEDAELPAFFRRADVVVLPYREIDQSGVLFTALAFKKPLLLTAVGGFPEIAASGAAQLVAPGDAAALHDALRRLVYDEGARAEVARGAARAADEEFGWDAIAEETRRLYDELMTSSRAGG